MATKEEVYRRIKIAGFISFIPIMLAAGPLGLFFAGDYLQKKFHLPQYFLLIFIGLGFLIAIRETIRIIRLVLKISKKP